MRTRVRKTTAVIESDKGRCVLFNLEFVLCAIGREESMLMEYHPLRMSGGSRVKCHHRSRLAQDRMPKATIHLDRFNLPCLCELEFPVSNTRQNRILPLVGDVDC